MCRQSCAERVAGRIPILPYFSGRISHRLNGVRRGAKDAFICAQSGEKRSASLSVQPQRETSKSAAGPQRTEDARRLVTIAASVKMRDHACVA